MTEKELLSWGFKKLTSGFEFLIKQYGGYHDFVFYSPKEKRLVIQYNQNGVELLNCNKRKANIALALVGLNSIDRLFESLT